MALSDVISMFVTKSGRADLNVSPYTEAIQYINAGQLLLDRKVLGERAAARRFINANAGSSFAAIKYCKSISDIWVYSSTGRVKMNKADLSEIKEEYDEPSTSLTPGCPSDYAVQSVRPIGIDTTKPEVIASLAVFNQQWALDNAIVNGSWQGYTGILFMPPADENYTLEIEGSFLSIPLDSTNNTKSYWTEEEPLLLAWAALYCLEVDMRNTEGAKDWEIAIDKEVFGINADIVEMENVNEMVG